MNWLYIAAPCFSIEHEIEKNCREEPASESVKVGVACDMRSRLQDFNCTATHRWKAIGFRIKSAGQREQQLKSIFDGCFAHRPTYDSEVLILDRLFDFRKSIMLAIEGDDAAAALLSSVYDAIACLVNVWYLPAILPNSPFIRDRIRTYRTYLHDRSVAFVPSEERHSWPWEDMYHLVVY